MKYVLLLLATISLVSALNYHGCTLAPDNTHAWVVCLDTILILYTTDAGSTWQPQTNITALDTLPFFDVTCIDEFNAYTCGILGQILHTSNGGLDWVQQVNGLAKYATRIEFIDANHGWVACGDGTIGCTTDGGGYWEQVFTPWYGGVDLAEYYGVSFVTQWDGWMIAGYPDSLLPGQGLIVHSDDGGLGWDSLYATSDYKDLLDVYFFNLLDGIVVGGDDQTKTPFILKTSDGGASWDTITAPANTYYLRAVDFVDNEGWVVGKHGTIIHTTNYGSTWAFQPNPAESTLFDVDFTDNLHGIASGYNIILFTTNGGQNWLSINEETGYAAPYMTNLTVYPNPFRKTTNFNVQIPSTKSQTNPNLQTSIKIYDIAGRSVKNLLLPTAYSLLPTELSWDGTDDRGSALSRGVYFVKLEAGSYQDVAKIILLR